MGLGEANLLDDGDGGGCKADAASLVTCSICFELVTDVGERSWAELQCGHRFHLDCIGSAFNAKGSMQCPNCRRVEKGQWLYANGCRSATDFSMEDWGHYDDFFDFNYTEMSFGVHWCPYSGLTSIPSSIDEGEFSPNTSHPCPYIAYVGPIHPSSASTPGISDGSSFSTQWIGPGPSLPNESPNSYGFTPMDPHYTPWDQPSHFASSIREQVSMPPITHRTPRNNSSDISRPGFHPFVVTHSSVARAPASSLLPLFPGDLVTPQTRSPAAGYFPQSRRRSSNHRIMAHNPVASSSSSDQASGFYFMSSSRPFQEAEHRNSMWEPPAPAPAPRSNTSRQRRGSERMMMPHHHQS